MSQTFNLGGLGDNKLTKLIFSNGTANTCSISLDSLGYLVFEQGANTVTFPLGDLPSNVRLAVENGIVKQGTIPENRIIYNNNDDVSDDVSDDDSIIVDGITEDELTNAVADALGVENLFSAKNEPQAGDGVYPGFANAMYFNGSSNYLSKAANSNASEDAYTISFWFKPSSLKRVEQKIYCYGTPANEASLRLLDNGEFVEFGCYTGGYTAQYRTKGSIVDTSSYYHFVGAIDRRTSLIELYINGVMPERDTSNTKDPGSTTNLYTRTDSGFGRHLSQPHSNIHGYAANIQFIDGQALDASYFGQYLQVDGEESNIWIPKPLDSDIDYGPNGFYLDFSRNTVSGNDITIVHDVAPLTGTHTSANDWTAN